MNHQKGWGFPTKDIQKAIEARGDLSLDEMQVLYIAEIRKWFAENEHRFPEWKPGDPRPERPDPETDKSDK